MKAISPVRGIIIEHSVAVEEMITNQICLFLNIDKQASAVFGTGSQSMPFNYKIALLKELNFYDATQKLKLTRFSEIRNKFAHLAEIKTFTNCFEAVDGLLKNMNKWYPNVAMATYPTDEEKYKALYLKLFLEIGEQVDRFVAFYNNRLRDTNELGVKKQYFDIMLEVMEETAKNEYKDVPVIDEFMQKVFLRATERYDQQESNIFVQTTIANQP
jgi:hypothetical protein